MIRSAGPILREKSDAGRSAHPHPTVNDRSDFARIRVIKIKENFAGDTDREMLHLLRHVNPLADGPSFQKLFGFLDERVSISIDGLFMKWRSD